MKKAHLHTFKSYVPGITIFRFLSSFLWYLFQFSYIITLCSYLMVFQFWSHYLPASQNGKWRFSFLFQLLVDVSPSSPLSEQMFLFSWEKFLSQFYWKIFPISIMIFSQIYILLYMIIVYKYYVYLSHAVYGDYISLLA